MNIKRAKQEIKDTVAAYLAKDEFGAYEIPSIRQRPMLLIGPPGIGKTQIILRQICGYRILDFLFCTLDVHIFLLRYIFYSP